VAAAYAIVEVITEKELHATYIIPNALNERIASAVANAVAATASNKEKSTVSYKNSIQKLLLMNWSFCFCESTKKSGSARGKSFAFSHPTKVVTLA
jgi:hypothetical protein